jgi:hypothetical protein
VRLPKAAPIVRRSLIAVAIAAVVGMAGMGAASLYKSVSQAPVHKSNVTAAPAQSDTGLREATEETPHAVATRPIDAAPAHPVALAPMLTGKDVAPTAPIGLTADQFKNSLGSTGGQPASVSTAKPTASLPNDEQPAAASPIHQTRGEPEASRQASKPTTAAVAATSAPAAATTAPNQSVPQPPTTDDHASSSSAAPARTHSYRHHSRSREEHSGDSEEVSAATKKPASANRAGANEVQMF